jgi:hypothetical protein
MRSIRFYRTEAGRSPVEEFLESLNPSHRKKVAWVLRLVEELDIVPQQYLKKLVGSESLWEIRSQIRGKQLQTPRILRWINPPCADKWILEETAEDSDSGD